MKTTKNSSLLEQIRSGEFKIAVYGLGHVGAPIASTWLRIGGHVIGVDKSPKVLENARHGHTHIPEPGVNEAFAKGLKEGRFQVYDDPIKASKDSHFKTICVPVLAADGSADLTAVKEVSKAIAQGLKIGDVVALNPSVPPGTTEEVVIPILEKEGNNNHGRQLKAEKDFYMLYNPERIYEGRAIEDIEERYPAIVAGVGPKSLQIGTELYSLIFRKGVMKMNNIRTAETEKLLEGVYRDVNIALANELAAFCERIGVNFWEAREAANSQPFCHIHKAGAGVGGACIPVYPQFILRSAKEANVECNITKLGRAINDSMPRYCVEQAVTLLSRASPKSIVHITRNGGKSVRLEPKVAVTILGLAFRGDVSDTRLSPTYQIIDELIRLGANYIRIHDPLVHSDATLAAIIKENANTKIILTTDFDEAINGANLIILATDHKEYRNAPIDKIKGIPIYDGRRWLDEKKLDGISYASIGVPVNN